MISRAIKLTVVLSLGGHALLAQNADSIGDGGPATAAFLDHPVGIALDGNGNLLVSEQRGHRVRRIDRRTGVISTIAGTGAIGSTGDGGPATQARINYPDIAVAPNGDLIIGEIDGYRIRRVAARTGIITTIAGTGQAGFAGDGGPAAHARITRPFDLEVDRAGNIYFTDTEVHRIRRIDAATGVITTVAGNGTWGFAGDDGPATQAALARPHVLALTSNGDLIIGDSFNQRIRRVDARTSVISTIAGNGTQGSAGDGGPAHDASFVYFGDFVIDAQGDLILSGVGDHRLRRIDLATGVVTPFAGTGRWEFGGDGGAAGAASFHLPSGLEIDGAGNIYVADKYNGRIRRIDGRTHQVTTIAGARAPADYPGAFHNHYDRAAIERLVHAPIALDLPGTDAVTIRRGLDYTGTAHRRKRMDVYLPMHGGRPHPVVVLVHTATRSDLDIPPTEWNNNISRARLLAASGFAVAVFNHELRYYPMRPQLHAPDLLRVLEYLRAHAPELGIAADRTCITAYGDGAPLLSTFMQESPPQVRCLVMFYPLVDIREPRFVAADEPEETKSAYSPLIQLARHAARVPPLLILGAARDAADNVADLQRMERVARGFQARLELRMHPGAAAFDVAEPNAATTELLQNWLQFLRQHLQ